MRNIKMIKPDDPGLSESICMQKILRCIIVAS